MSDIRYDENSGVPDLNGSKFWYLNGKLHRLDGPACEYATGYKAWYKNDQRHSHKNNTQNKHFKHW